MELKTGSSAPQCNLYVGTSGYYSPNGWRSQVNRYRQGVAPLVQARRLLAVLVQLGPSFDRTPENRLHLTHLLDELETLPVAVEFRHRSWGHDKVFGELENRKISCRLH